jgi:hypothetical protein
MGLMIVNSSFVVSAGSHCGLAEVSLGQVLGDIRRRTGNEPESLLGRYLGSRGVA